MLVLALLAAAAAPSDGKTMAVDDWRGLEIYGVGGDLAGPIYLQAHAGDLDGDGLTDDAVIKLLCADGALKEAHYVISPRDAGSGMATGRRQHAPVKFVKEWGPATPQLSAVKPTYNIKEFKGNERLAAASGGWTALSLSNTDGLCSAAAGAINTSHSNIKSK